MYKYTYGGKKGKKYSLKVAEDRVVVRTKNVRSLEDAVQSESGKDIMNQLEVEASFPESDVTILQARPDCQDKSSLRDEARSILKKEPELRFAGRVLVDEEGQTPVLYTENLFIKFRDDLPEALCNAFLEKHQLTIKRRLEYAPNSYFVAAEDGIGLAVFDLAETLLQDVMVELCHPELVRQRSSKAIHPSQWHLKETSINGAKVAAHANVEAAHQLAKGKGIIIAVIDDGVDVDHPEFSQAGKVVHSRDVTLQTDDPRPKFWDENHGTACAGVACAAGVEASGVAPEAHLMPIRLASVLGSMAEADAFFWAAKYGADVISCSWGPADGFWFQPEDPKHQQYFPLPDSTRLAIEYAAEKGRQGKGCVICWAAGNGNESISLDGYASFEKVLAVAACNDWGKRSVYSDFGPEVFCAFPSGDFEYQPFQHPKPLTTGIFTTDRLGGAGYSARDYTDDFTGTSSATPGIAGLVALILSVNPSLTRLEIKEILQKSCEKIDGTGGVYDAWGHSIYYGYGRPDALKAVQLASGMEEPLNGQPLQIIKALVDPPGKDIGQESITIRNAGSQSLNLKDWVLMDAHGRKDALPARELADGAEFQFQLSKVKLANSGTVLTILDARGEAVVKVSYEASDVHSDTGEVYF